MNYRLATEGDLEDIFVFWCEVFGKWNDVRERVIHNRVRAGVATGIYKILMFTEKDGKLAGTIKNEFSLLRYGSELLVKADVGEVAVAPGLQGKGLGTEMMNDNNAFLKESGADLSRLGGLCSFYSRFGYHSLPSVSWRIPLCDIRGGVKRISPAQLAGVSPDETNSCRALNFPDEISTWKSLINENDSDTAFTEMIDDGKMEYWRKRANGKDDVRFEGFFKAGVLVACVEVCGEPDSPRIVRLTHSSQNQFPLEILVKREIAKAVENNAKELRSDIPLPEGLKESGFVVETVMRESGTASSMIALHDLPSVLRKLSAVFNANHSRLSGILRFPTLDYAVENDDGTFLAGISISSKGIGVSDIPSEKFDSKIRISKFLRNIIGLNFSAPILSNDPPSFDSTPEAFLLAVTAPPSSAHPVK